jgi:hypothetical protein
LALDAADGVIDGTYFGQPIAGSGYPMSPYPTTGIYPATGPTSGFMAGANFGNAALNLDAADGVIDGKYFGQPIAGAPITSAPMMGAPVAALGTPYAPPTYPAAFSAPALPPYGFPATKPGFFGKLRAGMAAKRALRTQMMPRMPMMTGNTPYGVNYPFAPAVCPSAGAYSFPGIAAPTSSALALDAADGIIDGTYFGQPIAGAP